jgi:cytochrome c oxidase subunit 2
MKNSTLAIFLLALILLAMEGVSWFAFKTAREPAPTLQDVVPGEGVNGESAVATPFPPTVTPRTESDGTDGFPTPTTEVINGRVERTIHMGVRQWQWDPGTVTVKKGELIRLIIHNADVLHGLVIPELGVNQEIPPDGAVIEFIAVKAGSFEFFCSIWCGEGHMEMQGKLVVE